LARGIPLRAHRDPGRHRVLRAGRLGPLGHLRQIDGTDLEGHELRAGWAFSGRANAILRVFLVDAITSVQDGKRARLDFNYSF